tara:strand:+ start:137 stop:238 length:102 start_codon:yes stop_codon:yes gene_type:complete
MEPKVVLMQDLVVAVVLEVPVVMELIIKVVMVE